MQSLKAAPQAPGSPQHSAFWHRLRQYSMVEPVHVHSAMQLWQPSHEESRPRGSSTHWSLMGGGAHSSWHAAVVLPVLHAHCETQSVQEVQLVAASQGGEGSGSGSGSGPPGAVHWVTQAS